MVPTNIFQYLRTSASCQTNGKRGHTCLHCILDLPRHVGFGRNRIKNTFLHHRMAGSALRSPPCICMMQFHPETFVTMRTYHALIVCGALEGALLHVFGEFREFRCIRCRERFGKGLGPGIGKAAASDAHGHQSLDSLKTMEIGSMSITSKVNSSLKA